MSDPRFARLKSDPRFRRPRKHNSKVVIDARFDGILNDKGKKAGKKLGGRVDKYGRPISDAHETENLRRFYRLENEEPPKTLTDYARGEVLLESSGEEETVEDGDSDYGDVVALGRDVSELIDVPDDDEAEIDLDEDNFADLDAQAAAFTRDYPQEIDPPPGLRTHRLAVVNLDWDHVQAIHLYKIMTSLVAQAAPALNSSPARVSHHQPVLNETNSATRGKVLSVRVYPSNFGKERLAREEKEGPPAEVFKKRRGGEEEDVNEKNIYEVGGEDNYDEDSLRKYQLERLRYYYAIVTCDTVDAASHIFSELEGTELERSANVFDLSFVPNDMTFDDEFRDEATEDPSSNYKAADFVTDALRHSRVKLTWDEDEPERNQVTRRTLSQKEIEEADFRAYIASSTSSSELDNSQPDQPKRRKKKTAYRDKLRALLLGSGGNELPEGWGKVAEDSEDVDMEITFTPGLSASKGGDKDESTLAKYQQKIKEKRKKQKAQVKGKADVEEDGKRVLDGDDFFDVESGEEAEAREVARPILKGKGKKTSTAVVSPRPLTTPDELALLVASDNPSTEPRHFNLKSVLRTEKTFKGKRKKGKWANIEEDNELQTDFTIDVKDDRFKALHEDHTFAIDPSSPHFKKTKSMTALLEERSRRQKELYDDGMENKVKEISAGDGNRSLKSLVESVKRKRAVVDEQAGKRSKY